MNPRKTNNQEFREFFSALKDEYPHQIPVNVPCIVFENRG